MRGGAGLAISAAPFSFKARSSSSLTWGVVAALAPALAWGMGVLGADAALPLAASILSALAGEALAGGLRGRFTLGDGSAFLTGLLVGMAMPAGISPAIPAAASLFAVLVVKGAFGGLGSNWMNPALAGIAFALICWPDHMSASALPLAAEGSALDILLARGSAPSSTDGAVTDALNRAIFSRLGADLPNGYIDLLIGNKGGAIGEASGLLLIASSIVLLARRMIRWEIPASMIGAFSIAAWAFGGLGSGQGLFSGDLLFSLLSGSLILAAFFMATDPVTSPSSRRGMLVYGAGIGLIAFALRSLGSASEATAFAVILMNCAVPAISALDIHSARNRASARSAPKRGGEAPYGQ